MKCIHCDKQCTPQEGRVCDDCYSTYDAVMLDEIGDDEP